MSMTKSLKILYTSTEVLAELLDVDKLLYGDAQRDEHACLIIIHRS